MRGKEGKRRERRDTHGSSLPESDAEGEDVDEGVDLKHTEEEDSKVLKGLSEEIPEEAHIGSEVRHC